MNDLTGDEIPSPRANVEITREEVFDFAFVGKGPFFRTKLHVKRRGPDRSPTAKATTMLILVAVACLAAITIAAICKMAAAPALLLVIAALAAFAGALIAGTIISFRRDSAARSRQEVTPGHLTPNGAVREHEGNRTARAISREAHENGHGARKGHKDKKGRPGKPSRH